MNIRARRLVVFFVLFALLLAACGGSQKQPAPEAASEGAKPASTATATAVPPSPTPSPLPTLTPTPTPVPDIVWENPWTGETITITPSCQTPEIQALIAQLQQHAADFPDRWVQYWQDFYQKRPEALDILQEMAGEESVGQSGEWYTISWNTPGLMVYWDTYDNVPLLGIALRGISLGMARRYDYPEVGLTVFTACALLYDNDLGRRVYKVDELDDMPTQDGMILLTRSDPKHAKPQWYVGEIPVAYVVWPDGFLTTVPHAKATMAYLGIGGGSTGTSEVEAYYAPGCLYPYQDMGVPVVGEGASPAEGGGQFLDADCHNLPNVLNLYNTYVAMFIVTWQNTRDDTPYDYAFHYIALDEINYSVYSASGLGNPEIRQEMAYDWLFHYLSHGDIRLLSENPKEFAASIALLAVPHVAEGWQEALAGREEGCTPTLALTNYKIDSYRYHVSCFPEDNPPGFWTVEPSNLVVMSGDIAAGGLYLPIEELASWFK